MSRNVVPRSFVAAELCAAMVEAACGVAEGAALPPINRLSGVLCPDEAIGLMRLVMEERIRCVRCGRCVPVSRASGDMCLGCAVAGVREAEAAQ